MSLPQPANYLGLWYTVQDSQATGVVPSNQIILRKKAGDNTLYLETDAGEEKISTGGGGGVGDFTQVTITGNAVDTLLVQTEAKTEILRVDTNDEIVVVQGELQVQGDITLTGTLSTIMSNVLQFDDSLLKLSVGQTTTDAYDQGWYAEYSPNGVDVRYRGLVYDRAAGAFKCFTDATTEPDGLSGVIATGAFVSATGAFEASSNQLMFGFTGESITLNAAIPGAADYIYTIPDVGGNAQFLMSAGNNTITGQWTFTDLRLANSVDPTKVVNFNVSNVSTSTTRTMTMPNYNSFPAGLDVSNNLLLGRMQYSTFTTAADNVLLSAEAGAALTSGARNVAIGRFAFDAASTSNDNVIIGDNAATSVANNSNQNVAIGSGAFSESTSDCYNNVAIGYDAFSGSGTNKHNNIAIGLRALDGNFSNFGFNIAIGSNALGASTFSANSNIAIGNNAGAIFTTDLSEPNVIIGAAALSGTPVASGNVFIGAAAAGVAAGNNLNHNTAIGYRVMGSCDASSSSNVVMGRLTLDGTGVKTSCVAIGNNALGADGTWTGQIGIGHYAGALLTSGIQNTIVGHQALDSATTSSNNTVMGYNAATSLTTLSNQNVAIGSGALSGATGGNTDNIAIGYNAMTSAFANQSKNIVLGSNTLTNASYNASFNIMLGHDTGTSITTGFSNICLGLSSATSLTTADRNIFIGHSTGGIQQTGSRNIVIGHAATVGAADVSGMLVFGDQIFHDLAVSNSTGSWTQTKSLRLKVGDQVYYVALSTTA